MNLFTALGPPAIGKVTAFVTREGHTRDQARELLVFRHPHAGVQLPAGTIEEGETPEAAALRETWEETGLAQIAVVAHLGAESQALAPDTHMVLRRVALRQHPALDAPEVAPNFPTYLGLRRGLPVREVGLVAGHYRKVAYEEYDGPTHQFAAPSRRVEGWVESDALTTQLVRHFFHLQTTEATPDTWVQSAEEWEHHFELYWVPLSLDALVIPDLIPSHALWLETYAEQLASSEAL